MAPVRPSHSRHRPLRPSWPNNVTLGGRVRLNTATGQPIGQHNNSSSRGHQSSHRVNKRPVHGHRSSTKTSNYVASKNFREGDVTSGHETINAAPANEATSSSNAANQVVLQSKKAEIDPFEVALAKYQNLFEKRLKECRKWVALTHHQKRIDVGVRNELMAYFGKRKYGERPSAKFLSKYACQALELSEHVFGTDLYWAKGVASMFGPYAPVFEKMIDNSMKDYGLAGPGYVGEEDLESWVGDSDKWQGSMIGEPSRKGKGKKKVPALVIDLED